MPTSTNVTNLKINELTEAQYDAAVQGGVIGANELSIITDIDDAIQVTALPTAGAGEVGKVYQFIGTTDANYTHGYFYECVSDGQNPATYSWAQTNVQPAGGSSLPSQTGNAGKFLTTDGTDASWGNALSNDGTNSTDIGIFVSGTNHYANGGNSIAIGSNNVQASGSWAIALGGNAAALATEGVAIGGSARIVGRGSLAIGVSTQSSQPGSIALGSNASATGTHSIQISSGGAFYPRTNSDSNTFKVGNENGNYEMMSANGTIPTDRFTTTPSADGTYTPTVTIASGVATRSWAPAASAPVVPATMPELTVADWSSNTQTVNVTGVTASNVVFVSPAPASASDYAAAGIVCTAQGAGTLTFTCTTVPSNAITVNVVILG